MAINKSKNMVDVVKDYLEQGNEITALDAVTLWNELNVRNKISTLRARGMQITSREELSEKGGKYKVYYLDRSAGASSGVNDVRS